jgi:hypothetical protein
VPTCGPSRPASAVFSGKTARIILRTLLRRLQPFVATLLAFRNAERICNYTGILRCQSRCHSAEQECSVSLCQPEVAFE